MADLVLSMLLRADAAQARAELATVPVPLAAIQAALQQVVAAAPNAGRAVAQAGQSAQAGMAAAQGASAGLAGANQSAAVSFEQLRASVDPAYAASERYRQVQVALAAMVESGEASQRAANIVLEQAASRYMGVATAAERRMQAERDAALATALATQGYAALRASLDPVYAASQRYEDALRTLDAAQAAGVITDKERARTLKLLDAQMIDTAGTAAREADANRQHAQSYEAIRSSVDQVYAVSRRYEAAVEALTAAQAAGVISDQERLRTLALLEAQMIQTGAAGQRAGDMANATNLGYQATDIMMMAAMGQSPMALTLQQGPQVIQILNDMRAKGQAIGPAILGSITSLINPMSLLTLGVIAGGAALAQWAMGAMGAGEEAVTLEERIERLDEATGRVKASLDRLRMDDPQETFGSLTAEVMSLSEALLALDRAAQLEELRATLDQLLTENIEPSNWDEFWEAFWGSRSAPARTAEQMSIDNYDALTGGQGPSLDEFRQRRALIDQLALAGDIEAVTREIDSLFTDMAAGGPITAMNTGLRSMLTSLADVAIRTAETEAYFNGSAEAAREAGRYTDDLREAVEAEAEARRRAAEAAIDAARADRDRAADLLADLDREAEMRTAIARYGEDSLAVAMLRVAQEREVYEAMVDALKVGGDTKTEIMAAWDAANGIVNVGLADAIGAAAGTASVLSANLWAAAGGAWSAAAGMAAAASAQIQAMTPVTLSPEAQADRRDSMEGRLDDVPIRPAQPMLLPPTVSPPERPDDIDFGNPATSGGTRPGGGGGAAAERDAVDDLIASLRDEIAIARELDPVQQELLRNREALAEATPRERAEVEALIRQRDAEAEAHERLQEQMAETRDLGADLVRTLVDGFRDGASGLEILASMLDKVADKLLDMASDGLTDALFGTGQPGGGTGLLGDLLGGLLGGFGLGGGGSASSARPHALGAVYDRPMYFAMGGGAMGVMAEAGAEAIMPLTHAHGAGVGALIGGRETTLPLARLASGKLGVDLGAVSPFAMGGAFGDLPAAGAPASWREALSGPGIVPAAPDSAGQIDITVAIDLRGAEGDQRATIAKAVREAVAEGLRQYDRALPSRVRSITADPRVR